MSRNQKAPLLAFVLVALVCGLILVDSMRGEALVRRLPISVLAPTQLYENVGPSDRGPSATEAPAEVPAEASTATSPGLPGELPDPFASTSSDGVSGSVTPPDADPDADGAGPGRDQASVTGDLLDALTATANDAAGSVSGSVPDPAPVTSDPGNGSHDTDPGNGPHDTGPLPGVGHGPGGPKNPSVGMANFGPDGGRPEIPVDEAEPTGPADPADPGAPADAVDESEETLPGAEQPQLRKPHNEARKRDRAKPKGKK